MDAVAPYAAPTFSGLDLAGVRHAALCADVRVLSLDLCADAGGGGDIDAAGGLGAAAVTTVPATAGGVADGVAFWFVQHMHGGAGGALDTGPGTPSTCWRQAATVLRPLAVRAGQRLRLTASARGSHVSIALEVLQ